MKRLMTATALLMATTGLASAEGVLQLYNWGNYTSPELLEKFKAETGITVTVTDYDSNDVRTMAVLDLLRRRVSHHGDAKRYLLSCFRRKTVDFAHAAWPELPTAWLTMNVGDIDELARDLASSGHTAVHPEVTRVTREMIETFHAHGVQAGSA